MNFKEIDFTKWAAVGVCFISLSVIVYFAFSYVLAIFLPFVIAWIISSAITPPSRWLAKRMRLPEKPLRVILMLLSMGAIVVLIFVALSRVFYEAQNLAAWLSEQGSMIEGHISTIKAIFEELGEKIPFSDRLWGHDGFLSAWDDTDEMISDLLSESVRKISASVPTGVASIVRELPKLLLFVIVTLIASFYFCVLREGIGCAIEKMLPKKWAQKIPDIKKRISGTALGYLKAYLLIFLLTFAELYLGLAILRIRYSFILALIIAFVDILPIFGTGIILVPWAVILLLSKNYYLGFGILIIYAIILLVRQIAEPKILGNSIGLDPLVTLVAMYAGFKLLGVVGMLIGPAFALVVKTLLSLKES